MFIDPSALAGRLGEIEIFHTIPGPILLDLARRTELLQLPSEEMLFRKNEMGRSLYLVLSGSVKVHDGDYTVAVLEAGSCFGELSLLDEGPRSMSISTTSPSLLARIDREVFFEVLGDYAEVMQRIMGLLTRRLRDTTGQTVENLRKREAELTRLVEERTAELKKQKEEAELLRAKAETEKREAEYQRLRAEQSEAAEQQFLANMSHEIRTPMNAVIGLSRLLLDKNPRPDQTDYLKGILDSSESLLVLINDILDLARIQSGQLGISYSPVSIRNLLQKVERVLHFRAVEKGLDFRTYCDPAIPDFLVADATRLLQILLNLAGNAVKFTESGSVEVSAHSLGEYNRLRRICFEVSDTGIGMEADQTELIFERFRQASGEITRRYGGTGLGLPIARQLTELFGGSIRVESMPGEGSVFRVFLDMEVSDGGPKAPERQEMPGEGLKGLRILLAEDNALNAVVASETLKNKIPGVFVRAVSDGQAVLQALNEEKYDLVLMDVYMPVMDGIETVAHIRRLPEPAASVPIVAFTASVIPNEIKRFLDAGMNAYLPKPFRDNELLQVIAQVTEKNPERKPPSDPAAKQQKYLALYRESALAHRDKMLAALAAGDREALRMSVHALKPQFQIVGMRETAERAEALENKLVEGAGWPQIHPLADRLLADISESLQGFTKI